MKNIIIGMALIAITAVSCNNGSDNTSAKNLNKDSTNHNNNSSVATSNNTNTNVAGSMQEMVSQYLQMKKERMPQVRAMPLSNQWEKWKKHR